MEFQTPGKKTPRGRKISVRFRNMNILLFAIAFCVVAAVMTVAFNSVTAKTSAKYAARYASVLEEAFGAHISKDIGLISKIARSNAVTEWLADEYDGDKKALAYEEMAGVIGELYSFNLYIGVEQSLNEYGLDINDPDIQSFDVLSDGERDDEWYFKCAASENDYILSVDIDHVMRRKRVWLDYKVVRDGVTLGVLSTGLEFSHVAGELFSTYDDDDLRGLIIDGNGVIYMDSSMMDEKAFLYDKVEVTLSEEFSDPALLAAVRPYLGGSGVYTEETPETIKLSAGVYRYMTIIPIRDTDWLAVIMSGVSSVLDSSYFIPLFAVVPAMLIAFAVTTSIANFRLIFLPLSHLERSVARMRESRGEPLYGLDRDDELGQLSNTIQDLFDKANMDALTGIYNRRFMENNLKYIMGIMSRSGGLLSVLMMDVDMFKRYNDTFGHDRGDVCLKSVAGALAGIIVRESDFAARYGGEEFVAVLPGTDEAGARLMADKLLESVRALNIPHPGNDAAPIVTVSVGAATGKVIHTQSWEQYIKRADEALYMSKQNGRNQYTYLSLTDK